MKFIFKLLIAVGLITTSGKLVAQEHVIKKHSYSFTDCASKEQVYDLQRDLQKMQFVTNVDVKYSLHKKVGVIMIMTSEPPITSEAEEGFKPSEVKKIISRHDIMPNIYRLIETSKK